MQVEDGPEALEEDGLEGLLVVAPRAQFAHLASAPAATRTPAQRQPPPLPHSPACACSRVRTSSIRTCLRVLVCVWLARWWSCESVLSFTNHESEKMRGGCAAVL